METRLLALFAVILLVLSGCAGIKMGQTKEQAAALADLSHVGVKGVTITFVKGQPPDTTFTNTPLDIVVELRNEGAYPVSGGVATISGYDAQWINLQPQQKTFNLEPKTKFNTFGGYDTAQFSSSTIYLPRGTDNLDQNFLASVCYRYRTEARIPVCIDPNPTSVLENEACRVTQAVPGIAGGQGGPVSVTAIREDAAPGQVSFLITIANQGDGTVIEQASLGRCPGELKFNDVDNVQYSVKMSGIGGVCKPDYKARLSNKQGTIQCTFTLSDTVSSAYQTVLEINLDYGYMSQKAKTVRIKSFT